MENASHFACTEANTIEIGGCGRGCGSFSSTRCSTTGYLPNITESIDALDDRSIIPILFVVGICFQNISFLFASRLRICILHVPYFHSVAPATLLDSVSSWLQIAPACPARATRPKSLACSICTGTFQSHNMLLLLLLLLL
jgi:hypothetical protein